MRQSESQPGTVPRAKPRWSPSGHLINPALPGARHHPNTKAGPGSIWLPVRPCTVGRGFLQTSFLSTITPRTQHRKKEALTECSSWSMLWARTGLKETGDRAPGFFLTARICRRARKAVAEGRGYCQARGGLFQHH